MRFKIDENLPVEVAELLNQEGHDTTTVAQQGLGGGLDVDVVMVCRREGRALITLDTDFADIRAYPPRLFAGLLVLRLTRQDKHLVLGTVRRLLPLLADQAVAGHLWIVQEQNVRIRE